MKNFINKILFIVVLIVIWQLVYMSQIFPTLMFPSVPDIFKALINSFREEAMISTIWYSMELILKGIIIGSIIGLIMSAIAIIFEWYRPINNMIVAIFDPLPGIALLPLAILWFGAGEKSIIFIIFHSVLWPIVRNMINGYNTISNTYVELGKNLGLSRLKMVSKIYIPATFPHLLSGFKVSWARGWRALISAEMIFGVSGSQGGMGWYIFTKRYMLETDAVFASLIIIICIGLLVEYGLFSIIEKYTIRKWGMSK